MPTCAERIKLGARDTHSEVVLGMETLAWRPWQVGPYSKISGAEPAQATDGAKREQVVLWSVPNWEEGDNPSAPSSLSGLLLHPGWRVAGWMVSAGLGVGLLSTREVLLCRK